MPEVKTKKKGAKSSTVAVTSGEAGNAPSHPGLARSEAATLLINQSAEEIFVKGSVESNIFLCKSQIRLWQASLLSFENRAMMSRTTESRNSSSKLSLNSIRNSNLLQEGVIEGNEEVLDDAVVNGASKKDDRMSLSAGGIEAGINGVVEEEGDGLVREFDHPHEE